MAPLYRGLAALAALTVLFFPRAAASSRTQWSPSPSPPSKVLTPSSVTVDPNGNTTAKVAGGVETKFFFDIRNQLSEVQQGTAILGRYGYDYDGRRIFKIGAEGIRRYTYDQRSVITEADQAGVTVSKYDYGLDQLVRLSNRSEGRSFFHLDALGSTVNLTTDVGVARESIFYNAWGQERDRVGISGNHFTFTRHEVDRETGLSYFGARFYDPEIGRFLSEDPFLGHDAPSPWAREIRHHRLHPRVLLGYYQTTAKVLRAPDAELLERMKDVQVVIHEVSRDVQRVHKMEAMNSEEALVVKEARADSRNRMLPSVVKNDPSGLGDSRGGTRIITDYRFIDLIPAWLAARRRESGQLAQGQNRYLYALNDPLRYTDPWGYYEADFHYGLTKYLARQAGFLESDAEIIAQGTERPDQDFRSPVGLGETVMSPLFNKQVQDRALALLREWHFVRDAGSDRVEPGSLAARLKVERAIKSRDLVAFGEGLHPYEDSWSHQGKPYWVDYGHAAERKGPGHASDQTHEFPLDAWRAAKHVYSQMLEFLNQNPRYRRGATADFKALEEKIDRFIKAQSKEEKKQALDAMDVRMPEDFWKDLSLPEKRK